MGLDYTDGCVNFRDLGAFLNLIAEREVLPEQIIYRGGSIDYVKEWEEIGHAQSVISLRNGPDPQAFDADYYHFPMANKVEKYDTSQKVVRRWLNEVLQPFENPDLRYPVLVHCLSGKDRTGIVIAALQLIMGVDRELIIEEYLLSDGDVKTEWITMAMDGIGSPEAYFDRVDVSVIRQNLQQAQPSQALK